MKKDGATIRFPFMNDPPKQFPHIPDMAGVKKYLRAQGVTNVDQDPGRYPTEEESLLWEQALRKKLHEAQREKSEEKMNAVRALMYGLTWELHEPPNRERLLGHVTELERWIKWKGDMMGGRGSSRDDQKEFLEEMQPILTAVRQAIGANVCGQPAQAAIHAIEECLDLAWSDLNKNSRQAITKFLRPLRDQLYYQYVEGAWCATAPKTKKAATG